MAGHDDEEARIETVKDAVTDMKLERQSSTESVAPNGILDTITPKDEPNGHLSSKPSTPSLKPPKSRSRSSNSLAKDEVPEEKVGGDITIKQEPGQPPKLARSASQKLPPRAAPLFTDLPDKTTEATSTFQLMEVCTYANKYLGYTEHAMDCDCAEEWDAATCRNTACGEDSDCINRATKMECFGDCGCGDSCQNQRFQRREYAKVSVIKTEKKGYGLRADCDLRPNEFIFEYIGEVINEPQFRRRMIQYDEEGIKHFYFMSLNKGEFVDATKKGNLGRFCNHSCNPNCYVDKWVVGEKLRMGIFAERYIKAGEELVFNYNVDRYGADPQPCYCGEPNCTGFIGGKTQTERATKLSHATIEALGIDDPDGWDTAVARRPRKKKAGEDDEEYVDSLQPKSLDENGVTKVMAALMQCKEKWIAVKLLGRIQRCEDERVRHRVVRMHGYQILNSQLNTWKDDFNVVLQILDILDKFPRLTRNKIIDSKIEGTVSPLQGCDDERVAEKAKALLEIWSALEVGYRIPRMKRDPAAVNNTPTANHYERRERGKDDRKPNSSKSRSRSRSRSRSVDVTRNAPRGPAALTRGGGKGHMHSYRPGQRPFRRPFNPLPKGWFAAESNGRTYYYSATGETTWSRPTAPAVQPPPPPKRESKEKTLQDIIDGIMNAKENTPKAKDKSATPATPADAKIPEKKEHKEKWRSYSEEKQKKLYENTLFPHVKYIVDKFKHKLPKDDLKRYAKEVAKKLVNSDFKNNRVEDPTKISEKQVKQVKKYCKEYFDKAVAKHRAYEEKKAERKSKGSVKATTSATIDKAETTSTKAPPQFDGAAETGDEDSDVQLSDAEYEDGQEESSHHSGLKRKRTDDEDFENDHENGGVSPTKRQRSASLPIIPPPPPPMSPSNLVLDDGSREALKRQRTEGAEDDEYGDSTISSGKRQRSETPPPPPPPPPPADIPPENIESENENDKDQEELQDYDVQEAKWGKEDNIAIQSPSHSPFPAQSISNHSKHCA
ncbi:histone methyltransferase set2 [Coccidioides immitis]|nr:histone methyltransferase set2 [Coccidioides immitis]